MKSLNDVIQRQSELKDKFYSSAIIASRQGTGNMKRQRPTPGHDDIAQYVQADGCVAGARRYCYQEGRFYRSKRPGEKFVLVNTSLPILSWFEVVIVRANPANPEEVWISLGENGLFFSANGGGTFKRLSEVEEAALISVRDTEFADGSHATILYMSGKVKGEGDGIFLSRDKGGSWMRWRGAMPVEERRVAVA